MKYISFSPYYSGLSNVIMSYELAISLAKITNRTLILPKSEWMVFISESQEDKSKWNNIWQLFEIGNLKSFIKTCEFYDVPEFVQLADRLETRNSWLGNMKTLIPDGYYYKSFKPTVCEDHVVFVSNIHNFIRNEDFLNFTSSRRIEDLNREEKFLHFENCLFGFFWYHVYPGGPDERNWQNSQINKIFTYKKYLYDYAARVRNTLGLYNAVHIRRNDFVQVHPLNILNTLGNEEKILEAIERVFPKDLPLYISSDETNKDFFKLVAEKYKIYYYDDFRFENISILEKAAIEQIICSQADFFYGTFLSTFTKRINIMRGILGKQAADYSGINQYVPINNIEIHKSYPWFFRNSKRWNWDDSAYLQWCKE